MPAESLIYAPNLIFKQEAIKVDSVEDVEQLAQDMLDTMYFEKAVGVGWIRHMCMKKDVIIKAGYTSSNVPV